MKKRIKYVSYLVVVVLVAICFEFGTSSPQPARAHVPQGGDDLAELLNWKRTLGIVPDQGFRITVFNLADTRSPGPLTFECMFFDQNGTLVFQTERREVPPRGFRSEDIPYEDLALVGEPVTGRKQVLVQVVFKHPRGTRSSNVAGSSLEIINGTGETAIHAKIEEPPFVTSITFHL